jgi:hypothetical protein
MKNIKILLANVLFAANSFSALAEPILIDFELEDPNRIGQATQIASSNTSGSPIGNSGYLFSSTMYIVDLGPDSPWSIMGTGNESWSVGSGQGSMSGRFGALNNLGGPGVITRGDGGSFTFSGIWKKLFGYPDSTNPKPPTGHGSISGSLNGIEAFRIDTLNGERYSYYSGNNIRIDNLTIDLSSGGAFLIDDLALNMPLSSVSDVSSPATGALICSLILCGFGYRKCRR